MLFSAYRRPQMLTTDNGTILMSIFLSQYLEPKLGTADGSIKFHPAT